MNPHEILPAPETERAPESADSIEYVDESKAAKKVELSPGVTAGTGALSAAALNDAQNQAQGAFSSTATTPTNNVSDDNITPMTADDVDLIEKEWVLRAKAIVEATMGDPYTQNKQISRIKADYIKKRYGKEVKFKDE